MDKKLVVSVLTLSMAVASVAQAASTVSKGGVRVVSGAKVLSQAEKASVDGQHCGCAHEVEDFKPGYGFGTTGHYGPPGQGFTPQNSWRKNHDSATTPAGHRMPPRVAILGG